MHAYPPIPNPMNNKELEAFELDPFTFLNDLISEIETFNPIAISNSYDRTKFEASFIKTCPIEELAQVDADKNADNKLVLELINLSTLTTRWLLIPIKRDNAIFCQNCNASAPYGLHGLIS